jgi:hypothetical protein
MTRSPDGTDNPMNASLTSNLAVCIVQSYMNPASEVTAMKKERRAEYRYRASTATLAIACFLMFATFAVGQTAPQTGQHDRAFWQSVVQNGYAPPAGASADELASELSHFLPSPDPELRDEFAYSILENWIYQKRIVSPPKLRALAVEWTVNLRQGIGQAESDTLFQRSFSALMLSVLVARDNAEPFLTEAEFRELLAGALRYLQDEKDERGYDEHIGWMHSAGHTADLLQSLASSRYFTRADQAAVLPAVLRKLQDAPVVFTFGEDERYARALLAIVMRDDFDLEGFRAWAARATPVFPAEALPPVSKLRSYQNVKNTLAKLDLLLLWTPNAPARARAADDVVRTALKGTI